MNNKLKQIPTKAYPLVALCYLKLNVVLLHYVHMYILAAPKPVENLAKVETRTDSISLSWEAGQGSKQDMYVVYYRPILKYSNSTQQQKAVSSPAATITGLFPGERYEIDVQAWSGGQSSTLKRIYLTTSETYYCVTTA